MTSRSTLSLKNPATRWMWIGIVLAASLPTAFGLVICSSIFVYPPADMEEAIFVIPVAAIFTFGTPWIAISSARTVQRERIAGFGKILGVSCFRASLIQACVAGLQITAFAILPEYAKINSSASNILFGMIIHITLWLFITLPLTTVCTLIYRFTAMRSAPSKIVNEVFA